MRRFWRVAVCDVKTQICQLQRFLCARDTFPLQFAGRSSQTSRIQQTDWDAVEIDGLLDGVARCAMRVAHNHAIVTEQSIQQARFSSIRCSVNYDTHAFTQNASLI